MRLKDKVAVVTGGSRGVGRAVCLAFAREGASVVVNYATRPDAAEEVVKEIEKLGQKAVAVGADVATWEGAEKVVKAAVENFGRIDVLVNNAGFTRPAMLHKMSEEDWQAVIDIHLKAPWLCIKAAFPYMTEQKSGSIINVASVAGVVGTVGQINYSAAKGGVIALTKSAARELAPYGIRANCVVLGIVETEMSEKIRTDPKLVEVYKRRILLGRFASPEEVTEAFVFLASDGASYITGQVIMVDGGYGMT